MSELLAAAAANSSPITEVEDPTEVLTHEQMLYYPDDRRSSNGSVEPRGAHAEDVAGRDPQHETRVACVHGRARAVCSREDG